MRALLVASIIALAATAAQAEEPFFTETGSIRYPNPTSRFGGSITERTQSPCRGPNPILGDTQGIDGYWIELPAGSAGRPATLDSSSIDMDVWFFDHECFLSQDFPAAGSMVTDLTPDEAGTIPQDARFAIVEMKAGALDQAFTFTISWD